MTRLKFIKEEFFTGDGLKIFKHLPASKTLSTIVYLVFNTVTYILDSIVTKEFTTTGQENMSFGRSSYDDVAAS